MFDWVTIGQGCEAGEIAEVPAFPAIEIEDGKAWGLGAGTPVDTAEGPCPVEDLRPGIALETLDAGPVRLERLIARRLPAAALCRLPAGIAGTTAPIVLGVDQRLRIDGWKAELYFAAEAVLVAARDLAPGDAAAVAAAGDLLCYEPVLERPATLVAAGAALAARPACLRAADRARPAPAAYPVLTSAEGRLLFA